LKPAYIFDEIPPMKCLRCACTWIARWTVVGTVLFPALPAGLQAADALAWPPITAQMRPWTWWWWHGSAVDETNIAHELQRFHDAGLGGVQVIPIYGVQGAEDRDIRYLTPRWMTMLDFTVTQAGRLDLGVDMTLGTGWCFGGPTVSDRDANASVVVKTFAVPGGEKWAGKLNRGSTQALVAFSADGKSIDLTDKISTLGEVAWTAPAGAWTVYAISQKPSGQKVKRAAPGGEGWMLNPVYPQAMRDWLPWFDTAFAHYRGARPQAVFQDSYEYRTDWAPDFFAQFKKLRGYRLQTELPALFGGPRSDPGAPDDLVARVKYDYRRTLSDLMAQQSEPAWIDWAHRNNFAAIYQAHGTPGNWLDLYGDADIPETEMFHKDRRILISKFASSAAHTQGRELTGAETGTWLKEHFTETLADVKYLADDMFLAGVNRIFYHGACYSPDDAAWPGWLFYAAMEMNPRNSIWHDVRALNDYVTRCQSVLQSGKPDNDILLYWPVADFWSNPAGRVLPMTVSDTDWFEGQPIGRTAHELWDSGYAFDYVSDRQLQAARLVAGKIQMRGGDYKIIVVPECHYIPLETFQQLLTLAKKGATVVFEKQLPAEVAGAGDWANRHRKFSRLCGQITLTATDTGLMAGKVGAGEALAGDLDHALAEAKIIPETMAGAGLSFVRRSFPGGWNYFIANRGHQDFDGWISPARLARSFAILDPLTGNAGVARPDPGSTNGTRIHLQLAAGQSLILRGFTRQSIAGRAWSYDRTNGRPVEISGNWNVTFITGGPALPADFQTKKLASWTTFPDTRAQSFAGTARYEITFAAPGPPDQNYLLDLGAICQSARVTLNGRDYGTLITPPFRVAVGRLKPMGNRLEIEVTNVSANRVRDLDRRGVNWKIFKDVNLVDENYQPFNAANWPLTDSGLLGPVTLTPMASPL
jgi:hypothetical protein